MPARAGQGVEQESEDSMAWMPTNTARWLPVWPMLAALFGCAAMAPVGPTRVNAPAVQLPIPVRVALQVDSAMPPMQSIEYRGSTWRYADAGLMQEAALQVFGQVFQEVVTAPTTAAPAITLQVNGSSSLNPVMNEYHANATVAVFAGADTSSQPLAFIAGTGQGVQPNPDDGIWQAYGAAFRQIAELLLADPWLPAVLGGY